MTFEKGFDPGRNNSYTEVNMGDYSYYFPNVTELTIINNGIPEDAVHSLGRKSGGKSPIDRVGEPDLNKDFTTVKMAILNYTSRLTPYLKPEWMNGWERLWTGLLDLDVIENEICKIGKQKDTPFNRIFVCKIISYLNNKGFFQELYRATDLTRFLEGDEWKSIRTTALCYEPDDTICKRIDRFIADFSL